MTFLEQVTQQRLLAVVRAAAPDAALQVAGALADGGVTIIELTYTTPNALDALDRLHEQRPELTVGMGTVRTPEQAQHAAEHGAAFLVSPHTEPTLAAAMASTGLPWLPGAMTPTEVALAMDLGATAVKLFPANSLGPSHLRGLRGPFPDLTAIPTGGIALDAANEWLAAGALAIGAGSELVGRSPVDEDALRARAIAWTRALAR